MACRGRAVRRWPEIDGQFEGYGVGGAESARRAQMVPARTRAQARRRKGERGGSSRCRRRRGSRRSGLATRLLDEGSEIVLAADGAAKRGSRIQGNAAHPCSASWAPPARRRWGSSDRENCADKALRSDGWPCRRRPSGPPATAPGARCRRTSESPRVWCARPPATPTQRATSFNMRACGAERACSRLVQS